MNLLISQTRNGNGIRGYVLIITMALASVGAIVMAIVLDWSSRNAVLTSRNNEYFTTCYAAEAATEKAFASVSKDYQNYGEGMVYSRLASYMTRVPSSGDSDYWNKYKFSNGQGVTNKLFMNRVNPTNSIVLGPPYAGLYALASTYQIIANAKNANSDYQITGAVGQEINLGTIPVFQFAIFYQEDMEVNPGADMIIRGLVHGNADIYVDPAAHLTFSDDISASKQIILHKKAGDPQTRSGSVDFLDYHLSGTSPLNLPIGTNTTEAVASVGDNVHGILEIPPAGESPSSESGTNRLYNKADMILLVSNSTVYAKSGVNLDGSATTITNWSTFLNTNQTFVNKRENLNVQSITIDVGQLRQWSSNNQSIFGGRDIQSIYVADLRPMSNATPVTNWTVSTNYVVVTNTTPKTSLTRPDDGTYVGVINNSSIATNSSPPAPSMPPAFNVTTNSTTVTTDDPPASGTYTGNITTNTTTKSSTTYPSAGTYVPPVTSKKKNGVTTYTYKQIDDYSYKKITTYSYSLPAFVYNQITGIGTNAVRMTNYYYSTNYSIFAQSGIVLTNGAQLPDGGLTVVTPNPLYISGNYNTTDGSGHSSTGTNTTYTRPAAVMADAINILSGNWNPAKSGTNVANRVAANTTVNAAFLSGIVPTGDGSYSGGVENFPRFLESWSGKTFTYNGSMTVLFNSRIATANWGGSDVYNPPGRNWNFDNNFLDARKLPPLTPMVISVTKGKWALIAPNTTSF